MDEGQGRKKFGPKLDATTSALPGPLSPWYDVPLNTPLAGPAQAPSVTRLSCTNLLTTSPNFDMLVKLVNLRF